MRFVLRWIMLLLCLLLLLMSVGGYILRQEPSTAYWILSFVPSPDTPSLQLISPNGVVRNTIIQAAPINGVNFICWLPDGKSFLYEWQTEDRTNQIRVLRLNDARNPKILTNHRYISGMIPLQNECQFIEDYHYLPLRNADGTALFRVHWDGKTLERISTYYSSFDYSQTWYLSNEKWLFYQASTTGSQSPVLFRQHPDGSERTALLEVESNIGITLIPIEDNTYFVLVRGLEGNTQIYYFTADDPQLNLIHTFPQSIFPYGNLNMEWLSFLNSQTQELYRIRPDGSDLTVMLDANVANFFVQGVIIGRNDIFYVSNDFTALYRRNQWTLKDVELVPRGVFDQITRLQFTRERTHLIFSGAKNGEVGLYRINPDGSDLQQLFDFHHKTFDNLYLYYDDEWMLISVEDGTVTAPEITYYRQHVEAGQIDRLLTVSPRTGNRMINSTPAQGEIILNVTDNNNRVDQQYRINVRDGSVQPVNYGRNLRFSPIIDTQWHNKILVVVGFGLLLLSVIDSIWRFRQ